MLPTVFTSLVTAGLLLLASLTFMATRYVLTGRVGFGEPRPRSVVWPTAGRAGRLQAASGPRQNSRYWGVEVVPSTGEHCCRFVERFRGVRFPLHDAPALPLPGCDSRYCQCRFEYLPERRQDRRSVTRERRGLVRVQGWSDRV